MVKIRNWKGDITYEASRLIRPTTLSDITAIVRDTHNYPSPVRVKGSHHSTTKCVITAGTVIDLTSLNKILSIDKKNRTITTQAGVLYIDAAKALEKESLQFCVNVEIGNITMGSAACCTTKDASIFTGERLAFGQLSSYCVGMKVVNHKGEVVEYTEEDEVMEMLRGSFGMLGVVVQVTFRVKELKPVSVKHVKYKVDEFAEHLEEIVQGKSVMLYNYPFRNDLVVEFREEMEGVAKTNAWQWKLRNWFWKTGSPAFGKFVVTFVPFRKLRSMLYDVFHKVTQKVQRFLLRGKCTKPADQIIRFNERGGFTGFIFSIWVFPQERYGSILKEYFQFSRDYFQRTGYRNNLLEVGYYVAQDRQSIFSYTREGAVLSIDPVSTGGKGWQKFARAYNDFCARLGGKPLFNQTPLVTPAQVKEAFKNEIPRFLETRRRLDPENRFYSEFYKNLLE